MLSTYGFFFLFVCKCEVVVVDNFVEWRCSALMILFFTCEVVRAAAIVGLVSPLGVKASGLFSRSLYWNFMKLCDCPTNGKIATDLTPFVKEIPE